MEVFMKFLTIFLAILLVSLSVPLCGMDEPTPLSFPIHEAVATLNAQALVKMNLTRHPELINCQDKQGNTIYHILKAQEALIPFYANNTTQEKLLRDAKTINLYLSKTKIDKQILNHGRMTADQFYSFLSANIQTDVLIPQDDPNSIVICQHRGPQKIYLKLCKLNSAAAKAPLKNPITMTPEARQKKENQIDTLHNFSTICDLYLHWGKKIHCEDIKNNAWVHLVLKNLKFNVKEDNANIYAILIKTYYYVTAASDNRPYQEVISTEPMQPAALIYLFFDNTDICYHRCLHTVVNKDIFEESLTRLNNKIK